MGITVKYLGLKDAPILVTPEGRRPASQGADAGLKDIKAPGQLYLGQGGAELRLSIRQQEQEQVLTEVGRRMDSLIKAVDELPVPAGDLTATAKTALSPLPSALTMEADQEAQAPAVHTVDARWPAQGGLVLSSAENPVGEISLADGAHTFTLTVDGVEHELAVEAYNGSIPPDQSLLGSLARPVIDTHEEFLGRLARAIDTVDPRIKASLEYSFEDAHDPAPRSRPLNRVVRLKVESVAPGRGPDFSLADDEGAAIGAYNLDQGRPPRHARVELGGELRDQELNRISLDQGHLTGEILDATGGPLQVAVKQGPGPMTQALGAVIAKYNDLVSYLDTHADLLRPALKDRLIRPLEERSRTLFDLGLKASPQGRLSPTTEFSDRIKGDFASVRRGLLGSGGWLPALSKKLKQIQTTGYQNFAADLTTDTQQEQARRAWDWLDQVRTGIVGGYY